jgi:serine/threonine-protein kinase
MVLPLRGRLLDGKFRLLEPIGRGGMAEVWLAVNTRVDRRVAIKLIRPEVARDDSLVGRFRAEARAAGRIGHRDICDILDSGVSPIGPFIVMELLRGRSLGEVITRRGALPHGQVVAVVRQALEGLRAAHEAGIVHRDLKPENVFLHRGDRGDLVIKLMDFGVAKFTDGTGEVRTEHGALLGTPEYMAPEQFKGAAHADVRTDVWALGAILYRALTGHNAFAGPTIAAILLSVASEQPSPIAERAPEVPAELAAVVMRCLAKKPAERFASVAELAAALAPFDGGTDGIADWLGDPPEPTTEEIADDLGAERDAGDDARTDDREPPGADEAGSVDTTAPRDPPAPLPPRPWAWIALGLAISAAGSYGLYELTRERPPEEEDDDDDDRRDEEDEAGTGDDPAPILPTIEEPPAAAPVATPRREPVPPPSERGATGGNETPPPPPDERPSSSAPVHPAASPTGAPAQKSARPAPVDPAGIVRAGPYVASLQLGPNAKHRDAKAYCDGLARAEHLGVGGWQLPNPAIAGKFVGNKKIKKGRYWTSALHQGRALVIALPAGDKDSIDASQRRRSLCVARWP